MKTDKTTIYDLFQKQLRYVVPIFQRGYVWDEERQWAPLWDDLVAQAADTARHTQGYSKSPQKHFLGAMVVNLTVSGLKRVAVAEVIDGQQRLITLQVLLSVIRDETADIQNEFTRADLGRLTANQGPFQLPEECFKVWPTSGLQDHLRAVLTCGSAEALAQTYSQHSEFKYGKWRPPRPKLVEAYLFFAKKLVEFREADSEEMPELGELTTEDRVEFLVDALIHNIQLVTIELDQEDDAQVIFETLNARGEPLTAGDLVRNFIFLTATRDGLDVARIYDEHWREFEEGPTEPPFWKVEERQGRLKRSRLDLFLFHYVTFRRREELKIGHLYQGFRDWWEGGPPREVPQELAALRRHAAVYRQLLAPADSSRFALFARRLRALDSSTVYPVVLSLAEALGTESQDFRDAITVLESFLVRRAVCGYNQKNYNRIFLDLLTKLAKADVFTAAAVKEFLAESKSESAVWPSDAEFERALINDQLYRTLRPRPTQMLLEALELASRPQYAEDITIHTPLTVEHVLPQAANEEAWPLETDDRFDEQEALSRRGQLVHTLGNLTLLTQPLNSSISNGKYGGAAGKQHALTTGGYLALNTYFINVDEWSASAIQARAEHLARIALKVWPGP